MIRIIYDYDDVRSITIDGVAYAPAELRAIIAAAAEWQAIEGILNTPDEQILAEFPDAEQYAAEMRGKFDTIARLTRELEAARARERIAVEAYERQQDAQRAWEAKYQAMTERTIAAEAVVRAAIDFLNDANASPIPLGNAVHMYEQKAKV